MILFIFTSGGKNTASNSTPKFLMAPTTTVMASTPTKPKTIQKSTTTSPHFTSRARSKSPSRPKKKQGKSRYEHDRERYRDTSPIPTRPATPPLDVFLFRGSGQSSPDDIRITKIDNDTTFTFTQTSPPSPKKPSQKRKLALAKKSDSGDADTSSCMLA